MFFLKANYLLFVKYVIFYGSVIFLISCSSDSEGDLPKPVEVDLNQARLSDFPLNEVEYVDIDIVHPEIEDGQETNPGSITITLPFTETALLYSLESVNLDLSQFEISPSVGEQQQFSEEVPVIYEITSLQNAEKSIHYEVKVIISPDESDDGDDDDDDDEEDKVPSIRSFEFLATNNAELTSDVNALKATEDPTNATDVLIYVIFPSSLDFSQLNPTIEFDGAKLEYRHNDDAYEVYPTAGKILDFKYPNTVDFRVSNQDDSKSTVYRIIADVANPIKFEQAEVVIEDVKAGGNYTSFGAIKWTNQGNHPILPLDAKSFTNVSTPENGGNANIFDPVILTKPGVVNPGEQGDVNISVLDAPTVLGEYSVTAVISATFNIQTLEAGPWSSSGIYIEDIYQSSELNIRTNIIEAD